MATNTDPTDEVLDAVADATPEDAFESPSKIARRAKVTTWEAHVALGWLAKNRFIVSSGNGAWTKYRQRRFGEVVSINN